MRKFSFDIFKSIPQLETERLILRKICKSDLSDVYDYASCDEVTKYLLWYPHPDIRFTKRYLSIVDVKYKDGTFYDWGIIDKQTGRMIGTCGFTTLDSENNAGQIGYVLNRKFWGQGIASEAARAVITFGFEFLGLNRIEAKYIVENAASKRVLEKCSMRFEGILRSCMRVKGRYVDVAVHSILLDEYQRIRDSHNN